MKRFGASQTLHVAMQFRLYHLPKQHRIDELRGVLRVVVEGSITTSLLIVRTNRFLPFHFVRVLLDTRSFQHIAEFAISSF
ncbi:MAG: hypothetical protein G01um10148_204 [Parcubacteria group bacterium Gr01-1014_8]|nr:MAG: hypothetical protein G01um10148_204 [Parcubacteria group bacterium Gr01-1014_8]